MATYQGIYEKDKDLILIINGKRFAVLDEFCSISGASKTKENMEYKIYDPFIDEAYDLEELFGKKAKYELKTLKHDTAENFGLVRVDRETEEEVKEILYRGMEE